MAVNKPVGDNARKGAVKKRTQRQTKLMGKPAWSKRTMASGRFVDQKKAPAKKKFKGVRKERWMGVFTEVPWQRTKKRQRRAISPATYPRN
jgi:hypothetical protein